MYLGGGWEYHSNKSDIMNCKDSNNSNTSGILLPDPSRDTSMWVGGVT